MPTALHIQAFLLGDWQTNCYVIHEPGDGGECWIIDAGFSPGAMIDYVRQHSLQPTRVLLTHGHVDHIAGLYDLRRAWPGVAIAIHRAERDFLVEPTLNLSVIFEEPVIAPDATELLEAGLTLRLGGHEFGVRHTPGHSPGGVTLYDAQQGVAFVGDALFAGSIGRTDFPTSDHDALIAGIKSQLFTLPDATRVYPGHGPTTTIGREKQGNPYVR